MGVNRSPCTLQRSARKRIFDKLHQINPTSLHKFAVRAVSICCLYSLPNRDNAKADEKLQNHILFPPIQFQLNAPRSGRPDRAARRSVNNLIQIEK